MVVASEVHPVMRVSEPTVGIEERRITRDSLIQQLGGSEQIGFLVANIERVDKRSCTAVKFECADIGRGCLLNVPLFIQRELRLQLVSDGLCDFGLDGEHVGEIAIVALRPEMRVIAGVD